MREIPHHTSTPVIFVTGYSEFEPRARAILRKKLGQVSAGLDPELMQAGMTLAAYHIERGTRSFVAYAKAMLADIGESIRPYLKAFYNAARNWPGVDTAGMDSADAVADIDLETIRADGPGCLTSRNA